MHCEASGVLDAERECSEGLSVKSDCVMTGMRKLQVKRVRCEASGVLVAKDKAIKRFIVRNIVDASAIRDIQDSSILEGESLAVATTSPVSKA